MIRHANGAHGGATATAPANGHGATGVPPVNPNPNDTIPASPGATHVLPSWPQPSPSINEAMISRHFARDPITREPVHDTVISKMRDAVADARLAAEKASRLAQAVHNNLMQTEAARHRTVKEKCYKLTQGVLPKLDSAMATCREALKTLEEKTAAPPRPTEVGGHFLASEVRQRLAAMPESQREASLATALAEDDTACLSAVICASPMLTGITKARQEALRAAWQKQHWATELDRIERLKKALADCERAGTLTLSYTMSLSDDLIIRRAEATERAVEDALKS